MQELIQKLQDDHGLEPQQAHGILNTVKEFIKEKFPMVGSAIDNMFSTTTQTIPTSGTTQGQGGESMTQKAEEVFDGLKTKVSGLFNQGEKS